MVGTLESHMQIAKALGLDVTELYKGLSHQNPLIDFGQDKNMDVFTHSDEASFEILTKNIMNKKMMPTLVRIEEGGKTNKEQSQGGTEKFIFAAVRACGASHLHASATTRNKSLSNV